MPTVPDPYDRNQEDEGREALLVARIVHAARRLAVADHSTAGLSTMAHRMSRLHSALAAFDRHRGRR